METPSSHSQPIKKTKHKMDFFVIPPVKGDKELFAITVSCISEYYRVYADLLPGLEKDLSLKIWSWQREVWVEMLGNENEHILTKVQTVLCKSTFTIYL